MFDKIFSSKVEQLWSLYNATTEISHPGEKGAFRELFVRSLITSIIPFHYGVGSGTVVDKWGRQSPQIDLIIYDKRLLPPLLEEVGHGVYPFDSVLRLIEVKSTLKKSDFNQLEKICKSVCPSNPNGLKMASKGNLPGGSSNYPFTSLIAYNTKISDIKRTVTEQHPSLEKHISQTCVLTKGIYKGDTKIMIPSSDMIQNTKIFLTILLGAIEKTAMSRSEFNVADWMFREK
ncbi:DUF6602 domain-containing protein [Halomonas marinisediminis]|uniref:DUF6602 domain-containing protein n=1 Tax=Halomonas marinisediminis TaxID=2546095 RepID=A0ABY2D644_9GAMM|nr:DUF6602 domain-containing protein [Halomonas marinisediminis]TDB01947.1 hypothetical protein E0702_11090 [Halomonas marinisediminis]